MTCSVSPALNFSLSSQRAEKQLLKNLQTEFPIVILFQFLLKNVSYPSICHKGALKN